MHEFIHPIMIWYFTAMDSMGLLGVVVLMAMESSIFPVPSELVVPPAAYLMSRDLHGAFVLPAVLVILASTVGSYLGSIITYAVSRALGRPLIQKYGKYILVSESKLRLAETWVAKYGSGGIFIARLLPVVRHLISIPAGIMEMDVKKFSVMTIVGSFIWCTILTVFGLLMAEHMAVIVNNKNPDLESEGYKHAFNILTLSMVILIGIVGLLYVFIVRRHSPHHAETPVAEENAATPTSEG
jgi:membrane protein DedA with SNARE-associated domain